MANIRPQVIYEGETVQTIIDAFNASRLRPPPNKKNSQTISHITAVGALTNQFGHVARHDVIYIQMTLEALDKMGIPIVENPTIDIVNFKDGRNFLKEKQPTQVVTLCHIYNPGPHLKETSWELKLENLKNRLKSKLAQRYPTTPSPSPDSKDPFFFTMRAPELCDNRNAWGDRIKQAGAKLAFDFGGEVLGSHKLDPFAIFKPVDKYPPIDTPTNYIKIFGENTDSNILELSHPEWNYLLNQALIEKTFLEEIKAKAPDSTLHNRPN